jgi:hypothetical protein
MRKKNAHPLCYHCIYWFLRPFLQGALFAVLFLQRFVFDLSVAIFCSYGQGLLFIEFGRFGIPAE